MEEEQKLICEKYNSEYFPAGNFEMAGVSKDFFDKKILPINGLRNLPEGVGSGWFFWSGGEISPEDDYFKPMHLAHLVEFLPEVAKYLALKPGMRIQFDFSGHEDVWFDPKLLIKKE